MANNYILKKNLSLKARQSLIKGKKYFEIGDKLTS